MKLCYWIGSVFTGLFLILLPVVTFAQVDANLLAQGERILSFRSDILINTDGSVLVAETIDVVVTNNQIKHGIYRDFPTTYKDTFGNTRTVKFDVVSVERDGTSEPFSLANESNGKRVYIGDKDTFVSPGVHTYKLTYLTNRQIGFFEDHDELFWNVTGNDWSFVIEKAEAYVSLPSPSDIEKVTKTIAYTGPFGSMANDYRSEVVEGTVHFITTVALGREEGLTIAVGWPKGIINEPTDVQKTKDFFLDNLSYLLSAVLIFIVLSYFIYTWKKVGRDPRSQSIVPEYEAPRGLSPAAMRYIDKMSFDDKATVASIISMGVKGYLKVDELKVNYRLTKIGNNENLLSEEEKKFAEEVFKNSNEFGINSANYSRVAKANAAMKVSLLAQFEETYFVRNTKYIVHGLLLSIAGLVIMALTQPSAANGLLVFMFLWITGWSFGLYLMGKTVIDKWQRQRSASIALSIVVIFYLIIEAGALYLFAVINSGSIVLYLAPTIFLNVLFAALLPRRTVEGQKLQDEIKGFKWFLSVTEKDRMNFHNPPEKTPELFEKFLPYALALGVENKWAEQFEEVFSKLRDPDGNIGYHPIWFTGHSLTSNSLSGFTKGLGSHMNGSIASSSTPPGRSSGFSGGGGSGGGGGGGGGGGW